MSGSRCCTLRNQASGEETGDSEDFRIDKVIDPLNPRPRPNGGTGLRRRAFT
jgi:hypothetical protein